MKIPEAQKIQMKHHLYAQALGKLVSHDHTSLQISPSFGHQPVHPKGTNVHRHLQT
jgi:hypothetical protein